MCLMWMILKWDSSGSGCARLSVLIGLLPKFPIKLHNNSSQQIIYIFPLIKNGLNWSRGHSFCCLMAAGLFDLWEWLYLTSIIYYKFFFAEWWWNVLYFFLLCFKMGTPSFICVHAQICKMEVYRLVGSWNGLVQKYKMAVIYYILYSILWFS